MSGREPAAGGSGQTGTGDGLPLVHFPRIPPARAMWTRTLVIALGLLVLYLLDRFTYVVLDLWLLESLGYPSVFWTNFWAGAALFLVGMAGVGGGIIAPALMNPIERGWRRVIVLAGLIAGLVGGVLMARQYPAFLLLFSGGTFGEHDPVFGNDAGFYAFVLPALWVLWWAVLLSQVAALVSSVVCVHLGREEPRTQAAAHGGLDAIVRTATATPVLVPLAIIGLTLAVGRWLSRYDLLWKNNEDSVIFSGAEYLDVTGFFSTLHYYWLSAFVVFGITVAVVVALRRLRAGMPGARRPARAALVAVLVLTGGDLLFRVLVEVRDATVVLPNEPVVQLPYIERHIEATLRGYGLDQVETVTFEPNGLDDPLPDAGALVRHTTMRNAPLWPGWVSYLERLLDPHHTTRVLQTEGNPMVYGPVLEILRQQQKLRMYYDFLDVDTVRYTVNGEPRMFVSALRETPMDPQPWLYKWGQRSLLFTHGFGMVLAPAGEVNVIGEPVYAASGIPARTSAPELEVRNEAVYYGEGAGRFGTGQWTMAFSNARGVDELDYPSDEDRVEVRFPEDVETGVRVDSLLKRLVLGWRSDSFFEVAFTDLLGPESRAHYYRTPLERAERVAPFLFYDTNPFAVADNGGITWLANALTTADRYPYSSQQVLGDKADDRLFYKRPNRLVRYARDAVKVTIDAYTGSVAFYAIADEPVLRTWAGIYPGLLRPAGQMPESIRSQLQYPVQYFHLQFDNVYKRYHMRDPMAFFNIEDLWDDADEVMGAILDQGDAITFSIEPYWWMARTGDALPAASPRTQFVQSLLFTNEKAYNLRAMPVVYQDGADYGRLVVLQIPKGRFYPGPEQADAAIDQDTEISQSINWWNRLGAEVIRGHTSALLIDHELVYVEPLFIRSAQNAVPQLKRVVAVVRGFAADGATLEEALTRAIAKVEREQQRPSGLRVTAGDVASRMREDPGVD